MTSSAAPQQVQQSTRGGINGHSRRRGGGASSRQSAPREQQTSQRIPASLRPTSVAGPSASRSGRSTPTEPSQHQGQPSNRGGGRGRNNRRGGAAPVNRELPGGRTFGGQLTRDSAVAAPNGDATAEFALRADAPQFAPGQAYTATAAAPAAPRRTQPRKRRVSKSTAADLATRLHEDIDNRQYECAICTSDVARNSKIWSCTTCWTVFHLSCIKQWASNSEANAAEQAQRNGDQGVVRQWRCPGCNLPQERKPSSYTCWCGKEHDPRSITGLPPHSCGQTCGKQRKAPKPCPHHCELLCHAGPCPPCNAPGPRQSCFCGKETSQKRCIETDYVNGWSCGQPCGDLMPCGEHTCAHECHEGLCGACEVRVDARCMCGSEQKEILCCDRDDDQPTKRSHVGESGETVNEEWTGRFRCNNECGRIFDCGKHICHKPCHAATELGAHCPRSPDTVSHCPCGKTQLSDILDTPRTTCKDAIPNCSKVCLKELPCGHHCQQKCHADDCMPCFQKVDIQCRCKRITAPTICHQGLPEPPQCTRVCHTTLNCGRHECGERCCQGERRAIERNAAKKKGRPLGSAPRRAADDFEAEHICTRMCGRTLKCGQHACQELCHKGPCGSCREAIFDEVSCDCGRTVLQPPLPCGTKPPPCRYECHRPKPCGHPQVKHNCHPDDEPCPSCPFLVEKQCVCGKSKVKNQQCWFQNVRCSQVCGRKLKCGMHTCRKTCHKPGECEDAGGKCLQACGRLKKVCEHPCEDQCHAPYPCKQDKPCPHKLLITCPCQTHKEEVRCGASATSEGNLKKELKCDDECARLERNRKLASALDIDPATHTDDHIPYAAETLQAFSAMHKWCTEQEREFRVFAGDENEKRLRFKPMAPHHRAFLHHLAEDFGLDSESMDPEPHRHVAVFKTPRFVSAPHKTLRDALRIRQNQLREEGREMMAHAQAKVEAEAKAKAAAREPFNGYLFQHPRFALTDEEIHSALASSQSNVTSGQPGPDSNLDFSVQFLPSEDVAIVGGFHLQPKDGVNHLLERALVDAKPSFARGLVGQHKLGVNLTLARFDDSLNVVRRESASDASSGGWSQVAAKAAAPRKAPMTAALGERSGFAVLSAGGGVPKKTEISRKAEKKARKKERKGSVVEDWEMEVERDEEELARAIRGGSGKGEDAIAEEKGDEQMQMNGAVTAVDGPWQTSTH